ncbi:LysM peptidoglycan-binding domain-containing protein [Gordoniibacillus kamchatkensis]|uniref:LysM peptidoglycan-binding domain-containing protein n=1 Tax=Gordoniibacillus kamchatkensis TaxID=1590651 RepID=UPI000695E548|nr:LysM peptidoglycan-binding domain-containing protein [Paenibacillus sp. VKM B-2647]
MGRMKLKSLSIHILALLFAAVGAAPISSSASAEAAGGASVIVDNFESYADDAALQASWRLDWSDKPNAVAISLDQTSGSKGMKLTIRDSSATWANIVHPIADADKNASAYEGVTFWLNNESSARPLDLGMELKTAEPNGAFNFKLIGSAQGKREGEDWKPLSLGGGSLHVDAGFKGYVHIAWDQFNQASWQCGNDQAKCSAPLKTDKLTGIQFGYNPSANAGDIIHIDDVGFYGTADGGGAASSGQASGGGLPAASAPQAPAWVKEGEMRSLAYQPAPIDNPLKGFMPYLDAGSDGFYKTGDDWRNRATQMPYSMEYFYEPLNGVMKGPNEFDWTDLDRQLNAIAARGHQAVFRFYVDYPDKPTGIPQYLLDGGLKTRSYSDFGNGTHATSLLPDWDDPRLNAAFQTFADALGKRYDGDPRIGFIMVGLIGFWGEWHTYPYDGWEPVTDANGNGLKDAQGQPVRQPNLMPSEQNQKKVLDEMDRAFNKTRLLVRYPAANETYRTKNYDIGYHDDSFALETLPLSMGGQDWHFWGRTLNAGDTDFWKTRPMGGEMRPEIQVDMWNNDPPRYDDPAHPIDGHQGEDYYTSMKLTHVSFLLNQGVFQVPLNGEPLKRALEGSRRMGYEYYAPKVYLDGSDGKLKVGAEIENRGVAPFYYDWPVELAAKSGGETVKVWKTDWKIGGILPDDDRSVNRKAFQSLLQSDELASGSYDMYLRVVNPLSAITSEANKFMFANAEQDEDGWLALGSVTLSGGTNGSYVVRPGDNLSRIAARFGTTWQRLQQLNHLHNPNLIFPGQTLVLP